jgi:large subunit ribosomal protein L17
MRHRVDGRQFGRNTSHRRAMFRNLAANLVTHERIVTTEAKAKELRRVAARLITKAKRIGTTAYTPQDKLDAAAKAKRLHVSRQLGAFLPRFGVDADGNKKDLVEKVLVELAQRFAERPGGYTRIIKLGPRKGDGAFMSIIEFVDAPPVGAAYEDDDDDAAPAAVEEAAAPAAAPTKGAAAPTKGAAADDEVAEEEAADEDEKEDSE